MPDKIRFIPYRSFLPESFKQKTPIPDRDEGSPRGATLLRLRKETRFYGNNGPPPVPPTPAQHRSAVSGNCSEVHSRGRRSARTIRRLSETTRAALLFFFIAMPVFEGWNWTIMGICIIVTEKRKKCKANHNACLIVRHRRSRVKGSRKNPGCAGPFLPSAKSGRKEKCGIINNCA